ncbi:hypothetical protein WAF17_02520 [Bernardetia sp. ABR2-2B]|uniref:hypothetical protein n=1 Tax=Bernardetia sp. ABR2-2B TaxID=3127472 RepID=UPI0030D0110C
MKTEHGLMLAGGAIALGVGGYVYDKETGKISKLLGKNKATGNSQVPPYKGGSPIKYSGGSYTGSGITPRSSKSQIKQLQIALIASGHLSAMQKSRTGKMVSSADGIWGKMTSAAVSKAGLKSPVTMAQLSSLKSKGSVIKISTSKDFAAIAAFISKELRSFTTDYALILEKLKDKTSSQIKQIDLEYRKYSPKGLKKDFAYTTDGGKVSFKTHNVTAIREILSDSSLSGVQYLVRTVRPTTIADENKGNIIVEKNIILGRAIKENNGKTLIQAKDNALLIAITKDLIKH